MPIGYVVRRLGVFVLVIWAAATVNFAIPRLSPADPIKEALLKVTTMGAGQGNMEELAKSFAARFGLDQPLWQQYVNYLTDLARFNLGYSIGFFPAQVSDMILIALPWTIVLVGLATLITFAIGTVLGAFMAWSNVPRVVKVLNPPLLTLSAIPYYLLGLILIYLFAFSTKTFPLGGGYSVGMAPAWSPTFLVEGLNPGRVFLRYGLRNAILPQITSLALSMGRVVSGAILVEIVFSYPGVGNLLYQSIRSFDYFVIYGVAFMVIVAIGLATLILDLLLPILDPRISYGQT